ncbi:MAG: hypothetical protein GC182_24200 [Rhodopseudomonas sp.]|nr:hypothetical protein [Rhodopseudomonas sp.]
MIPGPHGAVVVTLLIEPVALLVIQVLRLLFVDMRAGGPVLPRALVANSALCVAGAIVVTAWAKVVTVSTGNTIPAWTPLQSWVAPALYYIVVFGGWGFAHFWIVAELAAREDRRRAVAAEAEALKAELHHLRQQLDPHFLFNALNGIASEIPTRPEAAAAMVHELADYMRYSLDHRDQTVAPLGSEIGAVRAYLELQKVRFGDEFSFHVAVEDGAASRVTPSFLLQPLVENAVKHGLKATALPLAVDVRATCADDVLRVVVTGNGKLRPDWRTAGNPGVGLSVVRRRLDLHYPDRHRFEIRQAGTNVTVELELRGEPCSVS